MIVLYLETNFLMSLALGQDPLDLDVVAEAERNRALVLSVPMVCIMEAVSTIEQRLKKRISFKENLRLEIGQLERSVNSPLAMQFLEQLNQSSIVNDEYTNRTLYEFRQAVDRLNSVVRFVPFVGGSLRHSFASILIQSRYKGYEDLILPDNLIIHTILEDAKVHSSETKALLSRNSKDFGNEAVRKASEGSRCEILRGNKKASGVVPIAAEYMIRAYPFQLRAPAFR